MKNKINPSIVIITVFSITILISIVHNLYLNIYSILLGFLFTLFNKVSIKKILLIFIFILPMSIGTGLSFYFYSSFNLFRNTLFFSTRLYSYVYLGSMITLVYSIEEILYSLMSSFKLSPTIAFGILAPFNLISFFKYKFKLIQYTNSMRNINSHLWNPKLYLKIIIISLKTSQNLSESMNSNGFTENYKRTIYNNTKINPIDIIFLLICCLIPFIILSI